MKKKMVAIFMSMAMLAAGVTGCAEQGAKKTTGGEKIHTIGVLQFAEHGSLDNCRNGFLEGLKEEGFLEGENLNVTYQNASADMGTAGQIADRLVADDVELICAIATPAAQSAYRAASTKEIPVVYTACTDPVAAELATKEGTAVGEITGTSDQLPVEAQLEMIREVLPNAKTVGILYTTSEVNSVSAIEDYKAQARKYGMEIRAAGITGAADVSLAVEGLLGEVDCITNLTDNTVVNALPVILDQANKKKIPVFGSEVEQVKMGCIAAEGLDYLELGKQTGKMAAKILKGEVKASEMKFETISQSNLYLNQSVAEMLGLTIPESIQKRAVETFDAVESK